MAGLFSSEEINPVQLVCIASAAIEEGRDDLSLGQLLGGRLFGFFSWGKR
jgi:hypothetical protein